MTPRPHRPFETDSAEVRKAPADTREHDRPLELPAESVAPLAVAAPPPSDPVPAPSRPGRRAIHLFAVSVSVFAVTLLIAEAASYTLALFDRNPVLGAGLGALGIAALLSGFYALTAESRALSRQLRGLRQMAALREEARPLLQDPAARGQATTIAARVVALYENRQELAPAIEQFETTVTSAHTDREVLSLLVRQVLQPLDRQAYRIVSRAARDTGIGVTLSPAGLLDAALVIWRTNRMIRDIALTYGFRPGRIGRLALMRRVLENAAMAGAVEYFGDLLTAQLGASLASKISGRIGQGAFTAIRTARLGLIAIEACRPLPFTDEDRASLASLREEIVTAFRERG